jgi:hypothetical protein
MKRLVAVAVTALTWFAAEAPRAEAQLRSGSTTPPPAPAAPALAGRSGTPLGAFVPSVAAQATNPNFRISPFMTLPQAAFNTSVIGQAISNVPPYALGFNPYPQSVNFGPSFPITSPYGAGGPFLGGSALSTYGGGGLGGYGASLSTSPYGAGSLDAQANPYSPYGGGYGGYGGYGYYEDPYAGYLRGVADVTNAQGRFLSQVQQARLQQTQADLSKLDLRRRMIEEAAFERKNWLNPEAERVKDMQNAYARATREPPITEVLSGQALNDLYNHVYPIQEKGKTQGVKGFPEVKLDEDMLKQVNLTGAGGGGSIGLLKDRGKLTWPLVLQSADYDAPRKELTTLASDAVDQVRLNNPVGAGTLRDMMNDVRKMNDSLLRNVGEISPSEYVEAKRYLNGLESAIKALHDPNVGNQLNQSWAAQGHTVAELIDFMGRKGLKFAAATPGDEPSYRYIYQRLLAYDAALGSKMATVKTQGE